jgi:hypothetical protein
MAETEIVELSCNHCGRKMRMKKALLFKRGLCNYCGKKMALPAALQQAIDEKKRPDPEAQIPIDVECPICSREFTLKKSQKGQPFVCSYCRCEFVIPEKSVVAVIAVHPEKFPRLKAPLQLPMVCLTCSSKSMITRDDFGFQAECTRCGNIEHSLNHPLDDLIAIPTEFEQSAIGELVCSILRGRWRAHEMALFEPMQLIDALATWLRFSQCESKAFSPLDPEMTANFLSFAVMPNSDRSRLGGKPYLTVKWYDEKGPSTDAMVYETLRLGANIIGDRYVPKQFEDGPCYWSLQFAFASCESGCDFELFVKSPVQKITPAPSALHAAIRKALLPAMGQAIVKWYTLWSLFSLSCNNFEYMSDSALKRRLNETCGMDAEKAAALIPGLRLDPPLDLAQFRGHSH